MKKIGLLITNCFFLFLSFSKTKAEHKTCDYVANYKTVEFAGEPRQAIAVNSQTKCTPWTSPVKVGDVVRSRCIGAGGRTIFLFKIPSTILNVVHIQVRMARRARWRILPSHLVKSWMSLSKLKKISPIVFILNPLIPLEQRWAPR